MSASDAAPLPRLGEVFFDVRGESRTLRLSWYGDTGIAVFSIWHGGTCTGTFRLPIVDLPRMVESLRSGPPPQAENGPPPAPARKPRRGTPSRPGGEEIATGQTAVAQFGRRGELPLEHRGDPGPDRRDDPLAPEYRGDLGPEYRGGPSAPEYPGDLGPQRQAGYEDEPTGVYPGPVARHDEWAQEGPDDYRDDPLGGGHSSRGPRAGARRRRGGGPADPGPLPGGSETPFGDPRDRYPADYPHEYLDPSDRRHLAPAYPDDHLAPPYAGRPLAEEPGGDWDSDDEPPSLDRRNSGLPPPDSFPYGPPPGGRPPRQGGRNPGRH